MRAPAITPLPPEFFPRTHETTGITIVPLGGLAIGGCDITVNQARYQSAGTPPDETQLLPEKAGIVGADQQMVLARPPANWQAIPQRDTAALNALAGNTHVYKYSREQNISEGYLRRCLSQAYGKLGVKNLASALTALILDGRADLSRLAPRQTALTRQEVQIGALIATGYTEHQISLFFKCSKIAISRFTAHTRSALGSTHPGAMVGAMFKLGYLVAGTPGSATQ